MMVKRKAPVRHHVKSHKRQGKTVQSFYRGKGAHRPKPSKTVALVAERNDLVGKHVRVRGEGIGIISKGIEKYEDIPDRFYWDKKYPPRTEFVTVKHGLEGEGGVGYVALNTITIIPGPEVDLLKKEERKARLTRASRAVDQNRYKTRFYSHESKRKYVDSILKTGLDPSKMKTGFRFFPGKFVMFSGVESTNFEDIYRSFGGVGAEDSVYIIFEPTGKERSVLGDMLSTKKGRGQIEQESRRFVDLIDDWYYARKKVSPKTIKLVYDNKGNIIYKREKNDGS